MILVDRERDRKFTESVSILEKGHRSYGKGMLVVLSDSNLAEQNVLSQIVVISIYIGFADLLLSLELSTKDVLINPSVAFSVGY